MVDHLDIPEPDDDELVDTTTTGPERPYIAIMIAGKPDPYVFSLKDWHYIWNDDGMLVLNDRTHVKVWYNQDHILFTEVAK